jgi:hypothetical protein
MSITSNENKELLIQLLDNHPLNKQNNSKFMEMFSFHLERIHKERFSYKNNLTEMNKELLRAFQNIAVEPDTFVLNPKPSHTRVEPDKSFNKPPKIKIFEERLKEQQENFNQMNKPKKPQDIDFSDTTVNEDTINTDMDSAMKQRENELKKIMEQIPEKSKDAEEWIKKGGKKQNKKVTFEDTPIKPTVEKEPTTSNLYHKLKVKTTLSSQDEHTQLLKDSLSIQNNILTKLEELVSYLKENKKI